MVEYHYRGPGQPCSLIVGYSTPFEQGVRNTAASPRLVKISSWVRHPAFDPPFITPFKARERMDVIHNDVPVVRLVRRHHLLETRGLYRASLRMPVDDGVASWHPALLIPATDRLPGSPVALRWSR